MHSFFCSYSALILLHHSALILHSFCIHSAFILYSFCTHSTATLILLHSFCTQSELVLQQKLILLHSFCIHSGLILLSFCASLDHPRSSFCSRVLHRHHQTLMYPLPMRDLEYLGLEEVSEMKCPPSMNNMLAGLTTIHSFVHSSLIHSSSIIPPTLLKLHAFDSPSSFIHSFVHSSLIHSSSIIPPTWLKLNAFDSPSSSLSPSHAPLHSAPIRPHGISGGD